MATPFSPRKHTTRPSRKSAPRTWPGPTSAERAIGYQQAANPPAPNWLSDARPVVGSIVSSVVGVVVAVMVSSGAGRCRWKRNAISHFTLRCRPMAVKPPASPLLEDPRGAGSGTAPTPAPRADAVRNRRAVLDAARTVLAAGGLDASMDDIAAAAGVGVATVYRHFPNKAALVDAVLTHSFEALAVEAAAALEAPDVGAACLDYIRHAGRVMARDRVLVGASRSLDQPRRPPVVQGLFDVVDELLARARAVGAVRSDITADELPPLLVGAGDAANLRGRPTPDALERYLDVVITGLRAGG